jgi:hypothetical protein
VSISLPGATSRYPCAGTLDGEGEGEGEGEGDGDGDGEGDGDGDVRDDDAPGAPGPVDGPALVVPASAAGDVG